MKKIIYTILFLTSFIFTAEAKTIIRDTEIERYLKDYSHDIFISAGLNPSNVKIIIIQDDSPNAFVAGGMNIFIHTGLIDLCDTPEELIGVIAHETGHISGGHLARVGDELESTKNNALYSLILATVVGVGSGDASAGAAVFTGATETSKRKLLHYSRTQEATADQNAFRFLDKNHISSKGLLTFLEKLEKQSLLPESSQAEYLSTHPLSSSRLEAVKSNLKQKTDKTIVLEKEKFDIIKEKIKGYNHPRKVVRTYKDVRSFEKLYALTISQYRIGETNNSLNNLQKLIKQHSNNPYLYELKGQILRENGQIEEAIQAYKKANSLTSAPLIKIEYSRSMLDSGKSKYFKTIISNLTQALQQERQSVNAWKLLANAYKKSKNESMFRLSQAEADLLMGDSSKAKFNAEKASKIMKSEKKSCQRCLDIVEFIDQETNKKK